MSIADELKTENTMDEVFEACPSFREKVKNGIKTYGRHCILHVTHISHINDSDIPERLTNAVAKWAKSEGLNVEYSTNTYGVGKLVLTL